MLQRIRVLLRSNEPHGLAEPEELIVAKRVGFKKRLTHPGCPTNVQQILSRPQRGRLEARQRTQTTRFESMQ
jgi:hypothetical protein